MDTKHLLVQVIATEKKALASRKGLNGIGFLFRVLQEPQPLSLVLRVIQALNTIFSDIRASSSSHEDEFFEWVEKHWNLYKNTVLGVLQSHQKDPRVYSTAVKTLFEMSRIDDQALPLVHMIIERVISPPSSSGIAKISKEVLHELLVNFIGKFDDIALIVLQSLFSIIDGSGREISEMTFRNIMDVLLRYQIETKAKEEEMLFYSNNESHDLLSKLSRKAYTACWTKLFNRQTSSLPLDAYRSALLHMEDRIFPNMSSPLILSDFLTDFFDLAVADLSSSNKSSGAVVVPLLALKGLFVLMTEHKFDYPDFYSNLYRIISPLLFATKHREKLLGLIALFLKSTHLPAYLIASFTKRFARIALGAHTDGAMLCLVLIYNLLRRNSSCRVMIDRTECNGEDVFDELEDDPAKTNALDSSLWELKALRNHHYPEVSRQANSILGIRNWSKQYEDWIFEEGITSSDHFTRKHLKKRARNFAIRSKPADLYKFLWKRKK